MIGGRLILRSMRRAAVSCACLAWGILTLPGHLPLSGQTPAKPLTLQISTETGPLGGWAQIKVFAAAPALVSSGRISLDLDPAVFGNIAQVAVFSSTGDASGFASVAGQHVDATFSSPSGGAGQLPELPILVVTVPVSATAAAGAKTQITVDPSGATWTDPLQNPYTVTVTPAQFTVGGSLSVDSITPGSGLFAAGTVLQIRGTGFDGKTVVSADGVSISAPKLVSAQQINVTLEGATELTGKHFHFVPASGTAIDYYAAPISAPSAPPTPFQACCGDNLPAVQPLMAPATFTTTGTGNTLVERTLTTIGYALLNQNAAPVTVTFQGVDPGNAMLLALETLAVPANTLYFLSVNDLIDSLGLEGALWINASAPLQGLEYDYTFEFQFPPSVSTVPLGPPPAWLAQVQIPVTPSAVSWSWQQGTALPATATVSLSGNFPFQVSVPASARGWLKVTPLSGTGPATLTLAASPSSMLPANYSTTITVTPVLPASLAGMTVEPSTIPVSLTVSSVPLLSWNGVNTFELPVGGGASSQPLTITTNGNAVPFTVSVSTTSGGNWLSVSPDSQTTPATLAITANPGQLPVGNYSGSLTLTSAGNKISILELLEVYSPPATLPIRAIPASVSFELESGTSTKFDQMVTFQPLPLYISTPAVASTSGTWLTVTVLAADANPVLDFTASAVGLAPGTYQATVIVNSTNGGKSVQIPVTLTVLPVPTAQTQLTATPASLSLTAPAGQSANQLFSVSSGTTPVYFTVSASGPLQAATAHSSFCNPDGSCVTPATVNVTTGSFGLGLGTFSGSVEITWDTGSTTVPVSFTVTSAVSAPPAATPVIGAVLNGASLAPAALAPGEIATVLGSAVGPYPTALEIGKDGKLATTLNGAQLLINGVAAPLLYGATGQLNAIVPYEVGTNGNVTVQVVTGSQPSASWQVPLAPSVPAIFTISGTGVGQGAVLNQDSSINSASKPAARGSVIQIFATGEGGTTPAGVTGSITGAEVQKSNLPVTVSIGGMDAPVQYAGSAPDAVSGLLQVNALVPAGVAPGSSVSIVLKIGGAESPAGVTIAVD